MIELLVFDFDGLILDTEVPDFECWQDLYRAHGCELSLAEWAPCIGTAPHSVDFCERLEQRLGRALDRGAVRATHRERYLERVGVAPLLPGVTEYIEGARRLGIRLAIASSSSRGWVDGHLARFGLAAAFDCIRCGADVTQAKPDPELYLTVLAALGVRAAQAIAFEDSPNGVLAAKRAGLYCVAVPNPVTRELALDHADLVLPSLADLPLEALLDRLALG